MEDTFWKERRTSTDDFISIIGTCSRESKIDKCMNYGGIELLRLRLKKLDEQEKLNSIPLLNIEKTHELFMNAHFKPNVQQIEEKNISNYLTEKWLVAPGSVALRLHNNKLSKKHAKVDLSNHPDCGFCVNDFDGEYLDGYEGPKDDDYYDKYYNGMVKEKRHRKNRKAKKITTCTRYKKHN